MKSVFCVFGRPSKPAMIMISRNILHKLLLYGTPISKLTQKYILPVTYHEFGYCHILDKWFGRVNKCLFGCFRCGNVLDYFSHLDFPWYMDACVCDSPPISVSMIEMIQFYFMSVSYCVCVTIWWNYNAVEGGSVICWSCADYSSRRLLSLLSVQISRRLSHFAWSLKWLMDLLLARWLYDLANASEARFIPSFI